MQAQQLYQGRCALHALASGAWQRAGVGWCVLQLMQVQPGRYQLIGRDSANTQQVSSSMRHLVQMHSQRAFSRLLRCCSTC